MRVHLEQILIEISGKVNIVATAVNANMLFRFEVFGNILNKRRQWGVVAEVFKVTSSPYFYSIDFPKFTLCSIYSL